jgi:hypothetical protein
MNDYEDMKPEDVFQMITCMPNRGIKVTAHLEDESGDKVTIAEISESLVAYIGDQLNLDEHTAVNSEIFPLAATLATSVVPRFTGIPLAAIFFKYPAFRNALVTLSLSSILFWQYVQEHKLKIVTETLPLSPEDIERFQISTAQGEEEFKDRFEEFFDDDDAEEV